MMAKEKITWFGHYKDISNPKYTSVGGILKYIKDEKLKTRIDEIRKLYKENPDKTTNAELDIKKGSLPCICFSGEFSSRLDSAIINHSGLCILDFDHVDNIDKKKDELKKYNFIYSIFISPTGGGVKAVVRIPKDIEKHEWYYAALQKKFPDNDPANRNVSRVCYASSDPDIYINEDAIEFTECIIPLSLDEDGVDIKTDYSKVNTPINMIRSSVDGEKHGVLLRAAQLMGGYIAGGSVDEKEGIRLLEQEISFKPIKNIDGAKRTIRDGIKNGKTMPITDLEKLVNIKDDDNNGIVLLDDVWEDMQRTFVNGKSRGKTTHFKGFDEHFTWKKQETTLIIGRPNSGKTEFILQLMLLRSVFDKEKWGCFSPEYYPAEEFYDGLIHTFMAKSTDPFYKESQMNRDEYEEAADFVKEHFYYVYPQGVHSVEEVDENFAYLKRKYDIDGTLIDPFNQLDTKMAGLRDDQFLSDFLRERKRFSVKYNLYDLITSHPKVMSKDGQKDYSVPDIYDIAGGAMWSNKVDNIISIHRPKSDADTYNTLVEVHVKKIKKQRLVGIPGKIELDFKRKTNRYYFDGKSPFGGDSETINRINPTEKDDDNLYTSDENLPF